MRNLTIALCFCIWGGFVMNGFCSDTSMSSGLDCPTTNTIHQANHLRMCQIVTLLWAEDGDTTGTLAMLHNLPVNCTDVCFSRVEKKLCLIAHFNAFKGWRCRVVEERFVLPEQDLSTSLYRLHDRLKRVPTTVTGEDGGLYLVILRESSDSHRTIIFAFSGLFLIQSPEEPMEDLHLLLSRIDDALRE